MGTCAGTSAATSSGGACVSAQTWMGLLSAVSGMGQYDVSTAAAQSLHGVDGDGGGQINTFDEFLVAVLRVVAMKRLPPAAVRTSLIPALLRAAVNISVETREQSCGQGEGMERRMERGMERGGEGVVTVLYLSFPRGLLSLQLLLKHLFGSLPRGRGRGVGVGAGGWRVSLSKGLRC